MFSPQVPTIYLPQSLDVKTKKVKKLKSKPGKSKECITLEDEVVDPAALWSDVCINRQKKRRRVIMECAIIWTFWKGAWLFANFSVTMLFSGVAGALVLPCHKRTSIVHPSPFVKRGLISTRIVSVEDGQDVHLSFCQLLPLIFFLKKEVRSFMMPSVQRGPNKSRELLLRQLRHCRIEETSCGLENGHLTGVFDSRCYFQGENL